MQSIQDKIKAGALIVDVRSAEEYAGGHYPKAINVPVNTILERLDAFGDRNSTILVYCASGSRSAVARQLLRLNGFRDVTNVGGIDDMPG